MSTTWRVGIIGCGAISRNHLEAFAAIEGAEVTIVCDVDAQRAAETATRYGIPAYTNSVADLLASGVDIVSVCTPHPTHEEVVVEAAAAGVHVLCEKPIAIELESFPTLIQLSEVVESLSPHSSEQAVESAIEPIIPVARARVPELSEFQTIVFVRIIAQAMKTALEWYYRLPEPRDPEEGERLVREAVQVIRAG